MKALVAALLAVLLLAGACDSGERSGSTGRTDNPEESSPTYPTTGQETTESTPPPEATLGAEPASPAEMRQALAASAGTAADPCTRRGARLE